MASVPTPSASSWRRAMTPCWVAARRRTTSSARGWSAAYAHTA